MTKLSITILLLIISSSSLLAQSHEGFVEAFRLRQEGKTNEAIVLFRQHAQNKNFVLQDYAQFEIAESYFFLGNYSAAIPEYYKVVTNHPQSVLKACANLRLGKCYFNLKNYPRAIKIFRYLLSKYPESEEAAEARFLIGKSLLNQGNWREAYLAFEETDLYHPLSTFGKEARKAIKHLKRKYKKKLPSYKPSDVDLYKKGVYYFNQEDYEMASNFFNRLAREYPKSKYLNKAWLMLGRAEMQTQRLTSAILDLERATQGPPSLAGQAYYYLGLAYGRKGLLDKAIVTLNKVLNDYPHSDVADEAAYWAAYYTEIKGKTYEALIKYYNLIKQYPFSSSIPAAIWRMGRIYYWASDFQNAAKYLHLAQIYPPTEDTPRCYFFEAKALERLGNKVAAIDVYQKLVKRFDHTYYAYRAREKLNNHGLNIFETGPFTEEDFSNAFENIDTQNPNQLEALMEIWEQNHAEAISSSESHEAKIHLEKYKELINLGLVNYALKEARYLVNLTSETERESLQAKLGEMLLRSGNYRFPIRFAERKIKKAIFSGKTHLLSKKTWQLAYPKGYWQYVSKKAESLKLDPYLILALIREESRFNPKATSRSNAKGLMQIIPKTGREIAKKLNISGFRVQRLYEPALNIEMGSHYLANLIKSFNNNIYLALAGYNGGPNRIKNYVNYWYNGNLNLVDIDEFIESIPIRETRIYVQKVMGSYFEYKRLYERKRG